MNNGTMIRNTNLIIIVTACTVLEVVPLLDDDDDDTPKYNVISKGLMNTPIIFPSAA